VHITATHIPGSTNVDADKESRHFNDNTEWMLRPDIFKQLVGKFGSPNINLFALRLNRQVSCFLSWRPDPEATHIDAFSIDWSKFFFYAFRFSTIQSNCTMSTESGMGSSRRNNSGAELANTTLVFQTDAAANRDSLDHTEEQNNSAATMGSTQGSYCIRESYEVQGISSAATSPADPVLENYSIPKPH
jgi:hypothetical protein